MAMTAVQRNEEYQKEAAAALRDSPILIRRIKTLEHKITN
jgi:hypothetical protein